MCKVNIPYIPFEYYNTIDYKHICMYVLITLHYHQRYGTFNSADDDPMGMKGREERREGQVGSGHTNLIRWRETRSLF